LKAVLLEKARKLARRGVWETGKLDRLVAGLGDGSKGAGEVFGGEAPNGVELERDLVCTHPVTIGDVVSVGRHVSCSRRNSFLTNASWRDAQDAETRRLGTDPRGAR
jgi:hypothetical protein